MNGWSEADRYLLDRVRQHDADAWSQLVAKYQGRLLAFARARAARGSDPEDLVQDTFLNFLKGLSAYRGDASVETYLFLLLRRRVIETLRGRKLPACAAGDDDTGGSPADLAVSVEPSASWYVRQDERLTRQRDALAAAIVDLVEDLRSKSDFRDLQLAEMLFYAQMRNNAIAAKLNLDEKYIALVKHRWLKRLRAHVEDSTTPEDAAEIPDAGQESLLSDVWEEYRPSCPKRSTLGGHLLGTLDDPWRSYITFHVQDLGCRFCSANLDDLRKETTRETDTLRDRIMQSSVGFFRRPNV